MRHVFIINPASGPKNNARHLREQIDSLSFQTEVFYTEKAGDANRLAAAAAAQGDPVRIYACGGDGTLNEVVNAAAGLSHVAITNVPTGTGNDFLRIFSSQGKQRFLDLAALASGPQSIFDLIDCNGQLGINVVCCGIDARVAADVHHYKRLPLVGKKAAYLISLFINVLFRGISRPMSVELGTLRHSGETSLFCVCNARYYGGGFMPVGEAMPDDGVLDMLLIPRVSLLTFAKLVGKYAAGQYRTLRHIITDHHGQIAHITSPQPTPVVIDGEVLLGTDFTIRLSEKKVAFFYPPDVSYEPGEEFLPFISTRNISL